MALMRNQTTSTWSEVHSCRLFPSWQRVRMPSGAGHNLGLTHFERT